MLNVLYAGSPEASASVLNTLLSDKKFLSSCAIVGVLTNPPATQGRHKIQVPTAVETCARKADIPVLTPEHLTAESRVQVAALKPDILVCFAYGHIFGPKFLNLFKYGGINLHPSLLPKYRGPSPIQAAILNMDSVTGVSIQNISLETDAGDLLFQQELKLSGTETAETLLNECARIGAASFSDLLLKTAVSSKMPEGVPQSGIPSYTTMLKKDDGHIDWRKSAKQIYAAIRAYTPDPGCFTEHEGVQLRILEAEPVELGNKFETAVVGTVVMCNRKDGILVKTGKDFLSLKKLQWQSKKALGWKDFINGSRNFEGSLFE